MSAGSTKQNIVDWFDPHSIQCMEAYRHLVEKGTLPATGMPHYDSFEYPNNWQIILMSKMAAAWLRNFPVSPEGKTIDIVSNLIEKAEAFIEEAHNSVEWSEWPEIQDLEDQLQDSILLIQNNRKE